MVYKMVAIYSLATIKCYNIIFTSITEWYSNDTMILHVHVLMMNDQDAESEFMDNSWPQFNTTPC